jgi:hypothetical protein
VILPCAGGGSRLGLPFPKELAPLGPGRVVIDSCLDLIAAMPRPSVIVLEDGTRELTAAHIRSRLPGIQVALVRQDPGARDMPDAVLRLAPLLQAVSFLLLPDALYECSADLYGQMLAAMDETGFCFAAAKTPDLARLGALRTQDGQVVAYEDKPGFPGAYDCAWGALGFYGRKGMAGLELIRASAAREYQGPVTDLPLAGSPVVWLDGFRDCGTWPDYAAVFGDHVQG